jgi:hypothetical protein
MVALRGKQFGSSGEDAERISPTHEELGQNERLQSADRLENTLY